MKSNSYTQNLNRALRGGLQYDIASQSGKELENLSFSNALYESSMLRYTSEEGEILSPYFRFKGYSRLSDKQKCIEEIIRQSEIHHEDQIGIKVIKWIQQQDNSMRFKYISSSGLLFGMKYGSLELYDYNRDKHEEIILNFFNKALEASVPPLDVIRYWRFLNIPLDNDNIPPIKLSTKSNKIEIGKNICNKLITQTELNNEFQFKTDPVEYNTLVLYNYEKLPIEIEDENGNIEQLRIQYYRNDTLETIKLRYAYENNIPIDMVVMELYDDTKVENEEKILDVNVQYVSSKKWKYNELETKKILVNSIIDIVEQYPIDLTNDKTIKKSINNLSEEISNKLGYNKQDAFYLYLIVRYSVFDGNDIVDINTNTIIDIDEIIYTIENNIEYFEILLVHSIEKIKFKNIIRSYCESYLKTIELSKTVTNIVIENDEIDVKNNVMEKLEQIYSINNPFTSSNIYETNFTMNGTFLLEYVDLYELFNLIQCTHIVPFANINHFYKSLNNIKVPLEWCKEEDEKIDTLRFYINQLDTETLNEENYSLCEIKQMNSEQGINTFQYIVYGTINIEMNSLITKFLHVLPVKPKEITVKKEFGKGIFIMNDSDFNEDVFYDFATNEMCVKQMIKIDEKYKIHKVRGGLKFVIYLNGFQQTDGLKCILRKKNIEKSTDVEVKYFPQIAKVGKEVIVLQLIGNVNNHMLETYKKYLEQLFYYITKRYYINYVQYYCEKVENIVSLTESIPKEIIKKEFTLKEYVPDLFLSGYVRGCSYPPNIIIDDEKDKYISEGKQVMSFPKKDTGLSVYNYVCDKDKKRIYPGLRVNDMENNELYPYIPCCYQDNQDVKGSIRYSYENDIPIITDTTTIGAFITTRKLLKPGQDGALPPSIKNLLTMSDNEALLGDANFVRTYIQKGNDSIIYALKEATNKLNKYTYEEIIEKMYSYVYMNLLSQSNITIQEAVSILDTKSYIEVRNWGPILERIFNVKIAIFVCDKNDIEGRLSYTNYQRYYITNPFEEEKYKHMICILNTYGGEFDRIQVPHNELIVKRYKEKKIQTQSYFDIKSETSKAIYTLWNKMVHIKPVYNPLPIQKQYNDGYGKIREIVVDNSLLYISPSSPSLLTTSKHVSLQSKNVMNIDDILEEKDAILLFNKYNITNIHKLLYNNEVVALVGYINSKEQLQIVVKIKYPSKKSIEFPEYNIQKYGYPIPPVNISFLKQYSFYYRLTNYITSYACYFYSILFNEKNITIQDFSDYIQVVKTHDYGQLYRILDLHKNNIIINNKLIVTSEDIKHRTLFYLEMLKNYNYLYLVSYKHNKYIPSYYNHADDFTKNIEFTVYNNIDEYLETRRVKKAQYSLYQTMFKSASSYFFSNKTVFDNQVYLVIPAKSKIEAANRSIYYTETNIVQLNPLPQTGEYSILIQDGNLFTLDDNPIEEMNKPKSLVGKYVLYYPNKTEEYYFSMIEINM